MPLYPPAGSGGGAPTTVDYLVKTADAGLSAERVVTDTPTITWDFGTAGQAKATNVGPVSVTGLTADAAANSTTTGVKITGLDKTTGTGRFLFTYTVRYQAGATTTGVKFGVNHTGTVTAFAANMRMQTGSGAPTAGNQAVATQVTVGQAAARAMSTTAPNLGPSISVDTANADMLVTIEGYIVVTVDGNLELWHASEVAAASTVMQGSGLVLTKVG